MNPHQDPKFGSGGALAQSIANAIAAGATETENTNPGAVAAQDVESTTTTTPTEAGLITQAQAGPQGFTSPGYVATLPTLYQGHQEAAAAAGVGGLNAFGQAHKDWIESNKAQMIALGITPSHKDADGNLTGKYSSADWNAFQIALGNQASNANDETIAMDEVVTVPSGYTGMNESIQAGIGAQAPQYTGMTADIQANIPMSAGHPDWGQSGVAPNAGQQYTSGVTHPDWGTQLPPNAGQQYTGEAPLPGYGQEMFSQTYTPSYGQEMFGGQFSQPGYGGYDPFPPGQDFSWPNTPPPGMNIPGTPVQEDLGTGYASEQINMGMAAPLGTGGVTQPYGEEMFSTPSYGGYDPFPAGQPYSGQPNTPPPGTAQLSKPISPTLNIEELTNSSISSGGTKQQRRAALSKAGMDKQMLDNMSDVDVAIWNYAILEGGNEGLQGATFESLWPRVQELKIKFNSGAGVYR